MHENSLMLTQLLIIFAAAVVFVPLTQKLKLGSIIGYLVGGMLIGPSAFDLVNDVQTINYIAEFGVVFLLFLIGIEMKPQRLWTMRRLVLGLGGSQILLTGVIVFSVAYALGIDAAPAVIIGLGLALSSTAMGLQLLADNNDMKSTVGRTSFSVLLMQDLAVPILLSLVTVLASPERALSGSLALGIAEGIGFLLLTFFLSRMALKPILKLIASARVTEVFTAFALLLVLGMAYLMEHLGLSLAMGAFLAGMFLADSEYRHQIEADIQPFRGLLLGLFFMGIGMGIDIALFTENWASIIAIVAGLMSLKFIITFLLVKGFAHSNRQSMKSAAYLCQAGEFGFVLFAFAASEGLIQTATLGILMVSVALSMAISPIIIPWLLKKANSLSNEDQDSLKSKQHHSNVNTKHTNGFIIAGFGRVGQTIAIQLETAGYKYTAFDTNLEKVEKGRSQGYNVFYGDASHLEILRVAHADHSAGLILTMDDRKAQISAVRQIHHFYPDLALNARAHDLREAAELKKYGVNASVPETIEASLHLGLCALSQYPDISEDELEELQEKTENLRKDEYMELAQHFDPKS